MYVPCCERVFPINLASVYGYHYHNYLCWLRHILLRLGRQTTLDIWTEAHCDYDDPLLNKILAAGWQPGEQDADEVEAEIDETLSRLFSVPVGGVSVDEAREIMAQTPPFRQIAERFSSLNVEREVSTYQVLHLFFDGLALVAESLIDRQGKQGELIAYDAMLYGLRQRGMHQMEASEYLARRLERFTCPADTQDIFSAGLEVEVVPGSENEVVTLVKECEWARYYQERHPKVGYLLACSLDNAAYQAINPSLYLQRTSTLMEGGRFCDFRVYAFVGDESEVDAG